MAFKFDPITVTDEAGLRWMRVTPSKTLFRSTMIHEVITRGDCFAVCIDTGVLTVKPADMFRIVVAPQVAATPNKELVRIEREKLKVLQAEAAAREEQRASLNAMFDRMAKVFEGGGL